MPLPQGPPLSSPASEEKRRQATVFFSDIAGYSKLMGSDETGALAFLNEHDDLMRGCIQAHRGRVIKTIGDAFMAEFTEPRQAVKAAVQVQVLLNGLNSRLAPKLRHHVRIGLHAGPVADRDGDLFGDTVNIAARLEGQAPHGGICASDTVANTVQGVPGLELRPLEPRPLKNIAKAPPLFHLWRQGMEPRARRWEQRRQWARRASLGLAWAAGLLLLLGASALWHRWQDQQRWEPVLDQRFPGPSDAWDLHGVAVEARGLRLRSYGWAFLRQAKAPRPFRVRISYLPDPGAEPALSVAMAQRVAERATTDDFNHKLRHVTLDLEGPAFEERFDQALGLWKRSLGRLGGKVEGLDRSRWELPAGEPAREQLREFSLDEGRLVAGDGRSHWEALLSELGDAKGFHLVIRGNAAVVTRIQLYARRQAQVSDGQAIAQDWALAGDWASAAHLYHELATREPAVGPSHAFRLREALLLEPHEPALARRRLEDLARCQPASTASLHALFLVAVSAANSAHRLDAVRCLDSLLAQSPDHADAAQARLLLGHLHLGDDPVAARDLALQLLADRRGPESEAAAQLLLQAVQRRAAAGHDDAAALLAAHDLPLRAREALQLERFRESLAKRDSAALAAQILSPAGAALRPLNAMAHELYVAQDEERLSAETTATLLTALRSDRNRAAAFSRACMRQASWQASRSALVQQAFSLNKDLYQVDDSVPVLTGRRRWSALDKNSVSGCYGPTDLAGLSVDVKGGALNFHYDSGHDWGCGANLRPQGGPIGGTAANPTMDLRGAHTLRFKARARAGLHYSIKLSEAGIADPASRFKPGENGADGEQWSSTEIRATGNWQTQVIPLPTLYPNVFWGNQQGDHRLDLGALTFLDLSIPGNQGRGVIQLKDIEFSAE